MKKFVAVWAVVMVMFFCFVSFAEDISETKNGDIKTEEATSMNDTLITAIKSLPGIKQGVMFDVLDSKLEYVSTAKILSYKKIVLEIGYASKNVLIANVSYPIVNLKDLGVKLPILDLIEFNIGIGVGAKKVFGNNEFVFGPTATLINIKF